MRLGLYLNKGVADCCRWVISGVYINLVIAFVAASSPDERTYHATDFFVDAKVAALAEAARDGDAKRVDLLISQGASINGRGKEGLTPLMYSMSGNGTRGLTCLLKRGADPNLQTERGESAMSLAARRKESESLRTLLAHGGNPNLRSRPAPRFTGDSTPTPIYNAIRGRNHENACILIKAGANLNVRDSDGLTPLMSAAVIGSFDVMYVLLEAGADFRAKDPYGFTVTYHLQGKLAVITPAANKNQDAPIDVEWVDPNSKIAKSKRRCIEFLEKKGVDFKQERRKNAELEQRIRDQNERNDVLALHWSGSGPPKYRATDYFEDAKVAELAEAARDGDVTRIDRLISEGTDVNAKGKKGLTPLLYSMTGEKTEGFMRLLERGADPNAEKDTGESVLHFAAERRQSTWLKPLLARGADPNHHSRTSEQRGDSDYITATPLFAASRSNNPVNVRLLLKAGAKMNVQDEDGDTPLMCAAMARCYDTMYTLLESGADFRATDKSGRTATWYLMNNVESDDSKTSISRQKCVTFLESKGVDCEKDKVPKEEVQRRIEEIFSGKYDNDGTQKHDVPECDGTPESDRE